MDKPIYICLRLDKRLGMTYASMFDMFNAWRQEAAKLERGEITKDEYEHWRYTYPQVEAERARGALDRLREKKNEQAAE